MAKVPTAFRSGLGQQQGAVDTTPFQSFQVSDDAFGAGQGRALQTAGRGLLNAAVVLEERARNIQLAADKTAVSKIMQDARSEATSQMMNDFYSKEGSVLFDGAKTPDTVYKTITKQLDDIGTRYEEGLENEQQRQLWSQAWSSYYNSETVKASTHVSSQFRSYTGEVQKIEKELTEDDLGTVASQIEQDWQNAEKYQRQGLAVISSHVENGLNQADAVEVQNGWPDYVASSAVRGWFASTEGSYAATAELASGKFSDERVQSYWDSLTPKQRKEVSSDLISRAQKVRQLENDENEAIIERLEQASEQKVDEFYNATDAATRIELGSQLVNDPNVKHTVKQHVRETLSSGPVTLDIEEGIRVLEERIRLGDVATIAEANAFKWGDTPVATSETLRKRIYPLIEAMRDDRFNQAHKAGLANIGVIDSTFETDEVLKRRAAAFNFQMLQWQRSEEARAGGDPWEFALSASEKIKEQIKLPLSVESLLSQLNRDKKAALDAGDSEKAERILNGMKVIMEQADISFEEIK